MEYCLKTPALHHSITPDSIAWSDGISLKRSRYRNLPPALGLLQPPGPENLVKHRSVLARRGAGADERLDSSGIPDNIAKNQEITFFTNAIVFQQRKVVSFHKANS